MANVLSKIFMPLEKELPFLVISFLCIGGDDLLRELCPFDFEWICRLSLIFLFACLLTYSLSLIKSKLYKLLLYSVLFILAGIDIFLGMNFSIGISPQIFLLLAETNAQEAKEFIGEFINSAGSFLMIRTIIFYAFVAIICEYLWQKRRILIGSKWFFLFRTSFRMIVFCIILLGIYSCKTYNELLTVNSSDELGNWYNDSSIRAHDKISRLFYSFYSVRIARNEVVQAIESTIASSSESSSTSLDGDSLNIIVVIGESYIKSHSQLYGYPHETCPNLTREKKQGNLFVFDNVISPYNGTSASIKNLFSCNSLSDSEPWYSKPIFPCIFRNAGYKVYIWDNQKEDVTSALVSMTLQSFLYNDTISSVSYDFINDTINKYDGDFVDMMINSSMIGGGG